MTALPPVPKTLKVRVILDEASDDEVGTGFFLTYSGTGGTAAQYNTFAASVMSAWVTDLAALTPVDATLTTVKVADLTSSSSPVGEATGSHAGTRSGTNLPLNAAFSIQYQTSLRRRGGRWHGQQRWGTESDLATAQTWSTTLVSAALAAWTSFIAAVDAAGWSGAGTLAHVGVQYYCPPNVTHTGSTGRMRTVSSLVGSPGADLSAPAIWPVTGYNAYTRVGSQRRRLGKSGT